jgi:hypothetical protein
MYVCSHLDVHPANEQGRAGEQSVFADLICSQRCLFCSWRHMVAGNYQLVEVEILRGIVILPGITSLWSWKSTGG